MANPWFKMPSGKIRNDAKIAQLSQKDQRHYFWLLLLKNDGVLDNLDDAQDEELPEMLAVLDKIVANALWVSPRQADALKQRLMKVRLIDETWQPLFWDSLHGERAFTGQDEPERRAMTVAERVRNYRARKKAAEALAAADTDKTAVTDVAGDVTHVTPDVTGVTNDVTHVTNGVTGARYMPVTPDAEKLEKTNLKTTTYDDVTPLLKEEDAERDEDSYGEEEKSKAKTKEREGGFSEIASKITHAESESESKPAPSAQPPSVCDDWIFAESAPAEPEPAPDTERAHAVPEPAVMPEPMLAPSVQANPPLFDDSLFDDAEPAVPQKEAAAVDLLLFGTSPPPEPPPPAGSNPGKGKTGNAATKTAPAPLVQAEPSFDERLFDDDTFALTPEDEAEVRQILFGEPKPQLPPQSPPQSPPAGEKSRKAKTVDAAPKAATRAERATRIAENWTLSDKNRQWAKENRPDIDIDLEAKKFHNHFLGVGGKDGRRVDWDATWRKWALNAWGKPRASPGHHYPQHSSNRNRLEPIAI